MARVDRCCRAAGTKDLGRSAGSIGTNNCNYGRRFMSTAGMKVLRGRQYGKPNRVMMYTSSCTSMMFCRHGNRGRKSRDGESGSRWLSARCRERLTVCTKLGSFEKYTIQAGKRRRVIVTSTRRNDGKDDSGLTNQFSNGISRDSNQYKSEDVPPSNSRGNEGTPQRQNNIGNTGVSFPQSKPSMWSTSPWLQNNRNSKKGSSSEGIMSVEKSASMNGKDKYINNEKSNRNLMNRKVQQMRWHEYIDDRDSNGNGDLNGSRDQRPSDARNDYSGYDGDSEYLFGDYERIKINPLDTQDWRRLLAPRTLRPAERYTVVDWYKNIISIPKSQVLRRILAHLIVNVAVAVSLIVLDFFGVILPEISAFPHTTVATALGLLLIFRTNASYDRFWEARKTWTKITNTCRGIARMSIIYIYNATAVNKIEYLVRYCMAFPISLKHRLRGRRVRSDYNGVLTKSEISDLDAVANVPYHLTCKMSELLRSAVREGEIRQSDQQLIEPMIQELLDAQGSCERILRTPVPLSYSRHTSRFLSLWNFTLPFILVRKGMGMFAVVATFAVGYALLGIEEIGHLIEEPFTKKPRGADSFDTSIPLDSICDSIRADLVEALKMHQISYSEAASDSFEELKSSGVQ